MTKPDTFDFSSGANLRPEIDPDVLEQFSEFPPPQVYPPGTTLFEQGSVPHEVWAIRDGFVKLVLLHQGAKEMIVALRSAGWLLGAAAVVLAEPFPVTATTLTPCNLQRISSDQFLQLLKTDLRFSWHLNVAYSREVYEQIARIADQSLLSARLRLEMLMEQFISSSQSPKSSRRFQLPLRNWELAQLLGITPEHFSRILRDLAKEGTIRRAKGSIFVERPGKLRQESEKVSERLKRKK